MYVVCSSKDVLASKLLPGIKESIEMLSLLYCTLKLCLKIARKVDKR